MITASGNACIFTAKDFFYAFFNGLKRLPVTTGSKSVSMIAIILIVIRVPVATSNTFDELKAYAVAFNG
jgi:hypothetical protein